MRGFYLPTRTVSEEIEDFPGEHEKTDLVGAAQEREQRRYTGGREERGIVESRLVEASRGHRMGFDYTKLQDRHHVHAKIIKRDLHEEIPDPIQHADRNHGVQLQ